MLDTDSSLDSGTRQSSGWEVAVTLAQHTFLRAVMARLPR